MYCKGEYVVYGTNGVCQVGEITTLDLDGIPKDREYYVLYPESSGGKIYIPVENADTKMRSIISKDEAQQLIKRIPSIEPLKVSNEKLLEEMYKKCMRRYDCIDWIRLIKCIYDRKQIRLADGKNITAKDEKYMHMAEDSLYGELSIALEIPKEQVLEHIITIIEKNNEEQ